MSKQTTVTKYPPQTRINIGSDEGLFEKVALPYPEEFRNAPGRPRTHPTPAARQRAYRDRKDSRDNANALS